MKLSTLLDQYCEELSKDITAYNFECIEHYAAWASQHYRLIQNTPHLLHLCTANVDVENSELFEEFEHHLEEETKHDVMLLKDLQKLGYDLTEQNPVAPVISTIDLQHYYINKYGPLSFLGYGLLLEGVTYMIGKEIADRLAGAHNKRSVFMDVHVKSDDDHYPDGKARVDQFVTDERERAAFIRNLKTSAYNYSRMLKESEELVKMGRFKGQSLAA